ncbi:BTB/POZ domain-containing protein At5g48800-like [Cryptomeria japonica]|uniref:BTB/POZ domain-containing protein At5g48800-like n=1 Tax=Cryptomeria japonica TaxID=3369 RepID=UPI0027DA835A|nr:BTB/POZ domain-containing protein At5g48800-like [Cryptomeria japonica]
MISTSIQSCLDWLSLDVPSDLTVETGGARFALHKAPLVSKCGRIRRIIVLPNLANTIAVLRSCNNLLPLADDLQIGNRCIKNIVTAYRFLERIVSVIKARGVKQEIISGALMNYAHNSLDGLSQKQREQRSVVEGIAAPLPPGKSAAPASFLSGLLRTAITVDASPHCRMELESRLAMSLDRATSHDLLLVVSFLHSSDTLFDVEVVQRVVTNFWAFALTDSAEDEQGVVEIDSQSGNAMEKISTLMDNYLAEIAPDKNFNISKFIFLAEAIGEKGRLVDDGLYRAIDICLKKHILTKGATNGERNKLCKLVDCQKLSAEACMHAAKKHRLPLHVVVQVLYFDQLRLRHEIKIGSANELEYGDNCPSQVMNKRFLSALSSSRDGMNQFEWRTEISDLNSVG